MVSPPCSPPKALRGQPGPAAWPGGDITWGKAGQLCCHGSAGPGGVQSAGGGALLSSQDLPCADTLPGNRGVEVDPVQPPKESLDAQSPGSPSARPSSNTRSGSALWPTNMPSLEAFCQPARPATTPARWQRGFGLHQHSRAQRAPGVPTHPGSALVYPVLLVPCSWAASSVG